jgi:hypothetical protein
MGDVATNIENTVDADNNDWLYSNQSYKPVPIGKESTCIEIYIWWCLGVFVSPHDNEQYCLCR